MATPRKWQGGIRLRGGACWISGSQILLGLGRSASVGAKRTSTRQREFAQSAWKVRGIVEIFGAEPQAIDENAGDHRAARKRGPLFHEADAAFMEGCHGGTKTAGPQALRGRRAGRRQWRRESAWGSKAGAGSHQPDRPPGKGAPTSTPGVKCSRSGASGARPGSGAQRRWGSSRGWRCPERARVRSSEPRTTTGFPA